MESGNELALSKLAKACPRTATQIRVFSILELHNNPESAMFAGTEFAHIYDVAGDRDPESIAKKISNALANAER